MLCFVETVGILWIYAYLITIYPKLKANAACRMPKTAGLSAGHKAAKRRIFGRVESAARACRRQAAQCAPVKNFYNKALFCRPARCLPGAGCGQFRRRRKQAAAAQAVCAIIAGYFKPNFLFESISRGNQSLSKPIKRLKRPWSDITGVSLTTI